LKNYHDDEQFLLEFAAAHPAPEPRDQHHNEVFGPYPFAEKHYFRKYAAVPQHWSILESVQPDVERNRALIETDENAATFDAMRTLPSPAFPESTRYPQLGDSFHYRDLTFSWSYVPHEQKWKLMVELA